MDNRAPGMLGPALWTGAIAGVVIGIPGIDVLNCCTCFSLVIACGLVATYVHSRACRSAGAEFGAANGALVGLLAGLFFAVATTVVSTAFALAIGNSAGIWMFEQLREMPNLPPEAADQLDDAIDQLRNAEVGIVDTVLGLVKNLVIGGVFSTVGGLIGGAVFKVERPAAPSQTLGA